MISGLFIRFSSTEDFRPEHPTIPAVPACAPEKRKVRRVEGNSEGSFLLLSFTETDKETRKSSFAVISEKIGLHFLGE